MTTPETVSVAIATINEGPELEATVTGYMACQPRPIEIVVYDDNSLVRVSERLCGLKPPPGTTIKVVRNEGQPLGSGGAKRAAAERCTGDLVVISDSHVQVNRNFTEHLLRHAAEHPGQVLCPSTLAGGERPGRYEAAGSGSTATAHGACSGVT